MTMMVKIRVGVNKIYTFPTLKVIDIASYHIIPDDVDSKRVYGGESGIRTHGEAMNSTHDFQSRPFGLSGISP